LARNANTDGWGNKLVTIFARHLDSFILKQNLSVIYQIRDFGSGQSLPSRQFYLLPGHAKIALLINRDRLWWFARRDNFLAKVPGLVSAGCATNAYCPYKRAVGGNIKNRCLTNYSK
jgi:hypothetical protein